MTPPEKTQEERIKDATEALEVKTQTQVQQIYVSEAGRVIKAYEPRKRNP